MLKGLRPARVCRENSSSLNHENLSSAIDRHGQFHKLQSQEKCTKQKNYVKFTASELVHFLLSIMGGVSKSRTFSVPASRALMSLGMIVQKTLIPSCFGKGSPSLKSESMDLKCGNPTLVSAMAPSMEGTSTWRTERRVLAEKVTPFTSEKDSSLGM